MLCFHKFEELDKNTWFEAGNWKACVCEFCWVVDAFGEFEEFDKCPMFEKGSETGTWTLKACVCEYLDSFFDFRDSIWKEDIYCCCGGFWFIVNFKNLLMNQ